MLLLSPIRVGESRVVLPLLDETARSILAAILCEDGERRVQLLRDSFQRDPAWLIWAISISARWTTGIPANLAEISQLVADELPTMLASHPVATLAGLPWQCPWHAIAEQVIQSFERGQRCRAFVRESCQDAATGFLDQTWIIGVLSLSPAIFAACRVDSVPLAEAMAIDVPPWLANDTAYQQAVAKLRSEMRETLHQAAKPQFKSLHADLEQEIANQLSDVRRVWNAEPKPSERESSWETFIPSVLKAVAELALIRTDFSRRLEQEKLASMAQLAYGAGHEINNPLANIASRAQTLLQDETEPERRRKLATINSQVFRAHEMIADMMLFAKPPAPQLVQFNLVSLVDRVISELTDEAAIQGTTLRRTCLQQSMIITADENQLAVALRALCANSLRALSAGGDVEIRIRPLSEKDRSMRGSVGGVEIVVHDNGPGIPPEIRRHIFDPFFSGREAGRGLGLGLSKCWRIITQHGGSVDVASEMGTGTAFAIRLPGIIPA